MKLLENDGTGEEGMSFKDKAWHNFVKNKYGRIKWFYEDI